MTGMLSSRNLIAALTLAATACAPLPDLSPYAAATGSVRQSASAAGDALSAEFDNFAAVATDPPAVAAQKTAFATAWKTNLDALDALKRYADSMQAIAAAGNEGEKSAQKVADQVQALAGSLGIPIAPAVGPIVSTGAKLFGQLQRIRGAKSLKESLVLADPAIRELEPILAANVASAQTAFLRLLKAQQDTLNTATAGNYGDFTGAAEQLTEGERQIAPQLGNNPNGAGAAALRDQLEGIAKARKALEPRLAEYAAKSGAIRERQRTGTALFGALRDALTAWTEAHAQLTNAVNNRQPVTFESLQEAITAVREQMKEWRKL